MSWPENNAKFIAFLLRCRMPSACSCTRLRLKGRRKALRHDPQQAILSQAILSQGIIPSQYSPARSASTRASPTLARALKKEELEEYDEDAPIRPHPRPGPPRHSHPPAYRAPHLFLHGHFGFGGLGLVVLLVVRSLRRRPRRSGSGAM